MDGINVSSAFEGVLGQDATTHIQLTIRDETHQIKVGSTLKGIATLRSHLVEFETNTILPATLERLRLGERVLIDPFEFGNGRVTLDGRTSEIPLATVPELKAGVLSIQMAGKRKKIALKKIWNPVTCMRLLTEDSL